MDLIAINGSKYVNSVFFAYDGYSSEFVFMSVVDKNRIIKDIASEINKKRFTAAYRRSGRQSAASGATDFYTIKDPDSDYSTLVCWRKDTGLGASQKDLYLYIDVMQQSVEERVCDMADLGQAIRSEEPSTRLDLFYDALFEKLNVVMPIPIMKEWMPYITANMYDSSLFRAFSVAYGADRSTYAALVTSRPAIFGLRFNESWLVELISDGLRNQDISIKPGATTSELMAGLTGLDNYLNTFSDTLASKIQQSFVPKYDPKKDKISERLDLLKDYVRWNTNFKVDMFPAQQTTVQAMVQHLRHNRTGIIIGEMGTGYVGV